MNSCAAYRKLALGQLLNTLDARQTRQLRAHLAACADCRRYQAELCQVTECLAKVNTSPDVQASEHFHRQVGQRLRTAKPRSLGERLAAYMRDRQVFWRVAWPLVAAIACIGILLATWPQPTKVATHRPAALSRWLTSGPDHRLAPTLANYERTANQSLEKLDALLTRQSEHASPAPPSYTAWTSKLPNESF